MRKTIKHLPFFILILTLITGVFFRFYQLGQTPSGFYVDEAALGYNAYSVFKTGKDEFGKFFPVMFRSFTTFQSPIYTYLTIPLIPLFGLTPTSTRFPSAFFGFLSILLLYFLVKKISPEKYSTKLALFSAIFLAISPWHILYSRTAYETNIALFFLLLGSLLFFYSLKKPWLFILSSISFAISFSAYRAEVLLVPLLVLFLFFRSRQTIQNNPRKFITPIILSCVLGAFLIAPTIRIMRTPGFQARTSSLNILSTAQQTPWGYVDGKGRLPSYLNNSKYLSVKEFISLYSSYFSPRYIFSLGDSGPRKPYPDLGTFFVWQLPLYLLGLYFLIKEKENKDLRSFVFILLLSSPIPAAFTRDPYSTIRSLPMVIPLVIIMAFGLLKALEMSWGIFNKSKYLIFSFLILYSSLRMFFSIFYINDYYNSADWNYGWQEVTQKLDNLNPNLPILVDASHSHPYILILFFQKYDPEKYQKDNFEVPLSEYYTNMTRKLSKYIGRITVRNFIWGIDTDDIEQYIVADNMSLSEEQIKDHNMTIIDKINYPNGEVALRILKTNPQAK